MEEPTAGTIELNGVDITRLDQDSLREHRREMQIIFQDPIPRSILACRPAILSASRSTNFGVAVGTELEQRVAQLFARVGLRPDIDAQIPA